MSACSILASRHSAGVNIYPSSTGERSDIHHHSTWKQRKRCKHFSAKPSHKVYWRQHMTFLTAVSALHSQNAVWQVAQEQMCRYGFQKQEDT